jgi:dynein heavy chain
VVQKFFDQGGETSKVNEHMPFNLKSIYGQSKPHLPVIFMMGQGIDPMSEFVKFSRE